MGRGQIAIYLNPPVLAGEISERPTVSAVARHQAAARKPVTNLLHQTGGFDEAIASQVSLFLALVDGTRDLDQLAAELSDRLQVAGLADASKPMTRADIERHLRVFLQRAC